MALEGGALEQWKLLAMLLSQLVQSHTHPLTCFTITQHASAINMYLPEIMLC